jgi:hypothetical protein
VCCPAGAIQYDQYADAGGVCRHASSAGVGYCVPSPNPAVPIRQTNPGPSCAVPAVVKQVHAGARVRVAAADHRAAEVPEVDRHDRAAGRGAVSERVGGGRRGRQHQERGPGDHRGRRGEQDAE